MKQLAGICVLAMLAISSMAEGGELAVRKPRVLLAWEKTRFKSALIEEMERELKARGCDVVKARHTSKGLDARAADYDAVFITNSGVRSKVRPWIVEWLAANKAEAARILLHTTQTSGWKVDVSVDAVTSASSKSDVKSLAAEYVARIEKILKPGGGE